MIRSIRGVDWRLRGNQIEVQSSDSRSQTDQMARIIASVPTSSEHVTQGHLTEEGQASAHGRNLEHHSNFQRNAEIGRYDGHEQQSGIRGVIVPPTEFFSSRDHFDSDFDAYQRELLAYKEQIRRLEVDNTTLKEKLDASQHKLTTCKDELFRLQPVPQTSDSEILNTFEAIIQAIVHWVDLEAAAYEEHHPEAESDFVFATSRQISTNRPYSKFGEYFVRQFMNRCITALIFDDGDILLGLSGQQLDMFQEAIRSMEQMRPPRDSLTVSQWVSETLLAITSSSRFTEEAMRRRTWQAQKACQLIVEKYPNLFSRHDSGQEVYNNILLPAYHLLIKMRTSMSEYKVHMPKHKIGWVKMKHLESLKLVDADTNRALNASRVIPNENGTIGRFMVPLEPALIRVNKDQGNRTLRRATFLIKLQKPDGQR